MALKEDTRELRNRIYGSERMIRDHYNGREPFSEEALAQLFDVWGQLKAEFKEATGRDWRSRLEKEGII